MKVLVNKDIKSILCPLAGGIFSVALLLVAGLLFLGASSNRYVLNKYSDELIQRLTKNEVVEINVYLEGDLTPDFRSLHESTLAVLNSFDKASQGKIKINVNLRSITPDSTHMAPISTSEGKIIYPYAEVNANNKTYVVSLLTTTSGYSLAENIAASIDILEYRFATAFKILEQEEPKNIAFVEGHGELDQWQVYDAEELLSNSYSIHRGGIIDNETAIMAMDALIIAGPNLPFNTEEKYILDQYIMSGGSVLWLVDGAKYIEQNLHDLGQTTAIKNELNIDDLLFAYGVRIEGNLVLDMQCTTKAVANGQQVSGAVPFPYAPLLTPCEHLINARVERVKSSFISSLSMVESDSRVTKVPLLQTSPKTALEILPHIIDPKNTFEYEYSYLPIAIALEGEFTSAFNSRPQPPSSILQKKNSGKGKMVVVAGSDIIRNEVMLHNDMYQASPMGWDKVTNETFDNRTFIENTLNWLTNDDDYLRLMNKSQIKSPQNEINRIGHNTLYSVLAGAFSIVVIALFASGIYFYRRKKHGK